VKVYAEEGREVRVCRALFLSCPINYTETFEALYREPISRANAPSYATVFSTE